MNAVKKRFTSGSSNIGSPTKEHLRSISNSSNLGDLSPELVPIVTLLSSQSHRRYYEGIFMLYYDLNGDGKPADREWKEVYGILTGNQLAYWDAANLANFKNNQNPNSLLENTSKPNYINFTDSVYNAMKVLPAAKQNLNNVIIISTTLKNRYIIQFKSLNDLNNWYCALRLSNFEYQSLQHAYTGALLSARGSRLSDIKTILAEKRFDHEDWVSIRYGSGMAWKRCYAVVEPSITKRKNFTPGRILFYENDQKKKKSLMAVVTNCSSVTAVYPQSHLLIDQSTMLKLEGYINFKSPTLSTKVSKKSVDDFKNTSIFLMPEQHSSVPGFDTLIRFFIPLLDSFGLYGRPKRLKAERNDPDSLLFGLPTLPHVHYLELQDLTNFVNTSEFLNWDVNTWHQKFKSLLKSKIDRGYEGCGSARGFAGALNSLNSPLSPNSSTFKSASPQKGSPSKLPPPQNQSQSQSQYPPQPQNGQTIPVRGYPIGETKIPNHDVRNFSDGSVVHNPQNKNVNGLTIQPGANNNLSPTPGFSNGHKSIELSDIYQKYQDIKSPSDQFNSDRNKLLNGAYEELDEDELPENIRKINLSENMYPTNDNDLFSEDDDEDEEEESLSSGDRVDSRQIGILHNGSNSNNLVVPPYNNRNSSYSSVQSPMTQYNEFNEKFTAVVSPQHEKVMQLPNTQPGSNPDFQNFSDSDPESPPPVPPHSANASPYKSSGRIHKPHYITSPNNAQNQLPVFKTDDLSYNEPEKSQPPPPQPQQPHQYQPSHHQYHQPPSQQSYPPPPPPQQQYQGQAQYQSRPVPSSQPLNKSTYNTNSYQSNQPPQAPLAQQQQQQPRPSHSSSQQFRPMNQQIPMSQSSQSMNRPPQGQPMPVQGQGGHPAHRRPPPQNYGVPPSSSFNSRQQRPGQPMGQPMGPPVNQQMGQMDQQRQQANMRNYGGNQNQYQYQYQYQGQSQPPPPQQQQPAQQRPNPYTRHY